MKLKLPYFLLTVFIFCTSTKSHSQREIHPLEPMFTYDYALKYYGNIMAHINIPIFHYCWIENFKAPVGVKRIEVFEDFPYYSTVGGRKLRKGKGKDIFIFNPDTGFF